MDSCRLARVTDADSIAQVQSAAWSERFLGVWPDDLLAAIDMDTMSHEWTRAILSPPSPRVRILVATDSSDVVVGFAALGPTEDPDLDDRSVELAAWEVHPAHRRHGHGSRLMSAVAATARDLDAEAITMWLTPDEDERRRFAAACGWGPDSAHRVRVSPWSPDASRVENRLVTSVTHTDATEL